MSVMSFISYEKSITYNTGLVIELGDEKRRYKSSTNHGYRVSIYGKNTASPNNENILVEKNKSFVTHT